MSDFLQRAYGWLRSRPSYMFLTAPEESLARQAPTRFARAWPGLMVQSLLWGIALINVWGWAWSIFGGFEPFTMPAAATLVLFTLWPYRRGALASLLDVCAEGDPSVRPVLAGIFVVGLGLCFLKLSHGPSIIEFPILPWWLEWVRPHGYHYRVLLLMPLWGAWSVLITPQFCRVLDKADPPTAAFVRGCSPMASAGCLVPILGGTLFYFHSLGLRPQVVISAVAALTAILAGVVCCKVAGGLCRRALLASAFLTQVAFLLTCLACLKP